MKVHPAAEIWPLLPDDELDRLARSIRANGLLEPIVLTSDGLVLDGRNRLAACKLARVKPTTIVYDGDPVAFVVARNNDRRHMTTGQRAMATAMTLARNGHRSNGKWGYGVKVNRENSLDSESAWNKAMSQAGVVLDKAPDLAPLVVAGTVVLSAAYTTARERRAQADSVEARMARLDETAADLAAHVRDESLTLADAEAARDARDRKRAEEQRDARALLTRIVDLCGTDPDTEFINAWADRLGDIESDLAARLDTSIDVLTQLAKRVAQ